MEWERLEVWNSEVERGLSSRETFWEGRKYKRTQSRRELVCVGIDPGRITHCFPYLFLASGSACSLVSQLQITRKTNNRDNN